MADRESVAIEINSWSEIGRRLRKAVSRGCECRKLEDVDFTIFAESKRWAKVGPQVLYKFKKVDKNGFVNFIAI